MVSQAEPEPAAPLSCTQLSGQFHHTFLAVWPWFALTAPTGLFSVAAVTQSYKNTAHTTD